MGNIVLFKPPKHGTLLHYPLLEAFKDSFPPGVINTLYGRGNSIIPQLIESGKMQRQKFSWDITAQKLWDLIEE
jgi:acyl-CoA reductase-like NAD-dependent aldehyde dehydrogenase